MLRTRDGWRSIPYHFAKENGAAGRQGAGQPHHLGSKVLDGQVVLQHHASQDGLQLWNARAWGGEGGIQILGVPLLQEVGKGEFWGAREVGVQLAHLPSMG